MNTKEKDELRESLQFPAGTIGKSVLLHHTEAEYLLKAIDHMEGPKRFQEPGEVIYFDNIEIHSDLKREHPQPLDAGEKDSGLKSAIQQAYELYEWETFWMYLEPLIAAQASITAKQKEWEREKADLINALNNFCLAWDAVEILNSNATPYVKAKELLNSDQ